MARVLLACWGSYGDLFPYLAVAEALAARGHDPVIASCPSYRELVEGLGVRFHPLRPDARPDDTALIARLMDPARGTEVLLRDVLMPAVEESLADVEPAVAEADIVVSHPVTFAVPIAAERLGRRWLASVLAPMSFFSPTDFPVVPNAPGLDVLRHLGPWTGRLVRSLAMRATRAWVEPVAAQRRRFGLPPGRHPLFDGQFSPHGTLALFSDVLGAPQPDWPPHTTVTGFPFFNRAVEMPAAVTAFLDAGPAPMVFTLGSAAVHAAGRFFDESLAAVRAIGGRALLLAGPFAADAPPLPDGVLAVASAPHDQVFPRAAAIVHQGGVGTTGQAIRSGRPQLVVPHAHDQYDNAVRVRRAGIGRVLFATRYSAAKAAAALTALRADVTMAARAADVGRRVDAERGAEAAAGVIERTLERA